MENKTVGLIIIGISLLMGFIIFSFNRALTSIVNSACSHGPDCPMWGTINFQTNAGIGIMVFVILVGLYIIFYGGKKIQVKTKKILKEGYRKVMSNLANDEKIVFEKIIEAKGTIFQSELMDKTNFTKVKITRVLDKLEGKGLVERKRRGMTNVVVLNH